MKYFEYIFPAAFFGLLFFAVVLLLWLWRRRFLRNLAKINILKRQQYNIESCLFDAGLIDECVGCLFYFWSKEAKQALTYLVVGRVEKAVIFLKKKNPFAAALLAAHANAAPVYKQMLRAKKHWLSHKKYAPYVPLLATLCFDTQNATLLPAQIDSRKLTSAARAVYHYVSAAVYLQDADMMSASKAASAALDFYKKHKRPIEEARCYLLLAEIYRISCVNDVAQTMIESALKIYKAYHLPLFQAQTTAVLGMLMLFENRLEEADAYFAQALSLAPTTIMKADILNQTALLETARNNNKAALKAAEKALSWHKTHHNERGTAFALQLSAHIYFTLGKYLKAAKLAAQAAALYQRQKNYSAYAESLYLSANARCKMQHYALAEASLREILENNRKNPNSFHTANAYSLLGLIYLQTGERQRAKVLFQQSLHLEQRCERCQGLAVDYANLALVENMAGNSHTAHSNLEIALEYAQKSEDTALIKLIEEKIKPFSNK